MRIFIIDNKIIFDELMENLLRTDELKEVIKVMSGIRDRSVFIKVIDKLLNMLSDEVQKNMELKRKLKGRKEEII